MNAQKTTAAKVKITKIGNSQGVILPKETLAKLKVEAGDELFLIDSPNGLTLSPYDPEVEEQMNAARKIMKKRRAALRELAK